MKRKLIALDLDGTALNQESKLTKKTIETIKKVREKGHLVTIATGRPYRLALPFYKQLNLDTPMVNFNGSLVLLPEKDWEHERDTRIQKEIVFDLLAQKHKYALDFISVEDREQFFVDNFSHFEPTFFGATQFTEKHLLLPERLSMNPNSILVQVGEQSSKETAANLLEKDFGENLDVNPWGGPNAILELVPKGMHKAEGIQWISQTFGIEKEDTLAFGDELNDVEMLKNAGLGVAMKNANDELKKVAQEITEKTNEEDGLADFLTGYFSL